MVDVGQALTMTTKLHHTALVTQDIEAATRFYRDGLGMQVTMDITPELDFISLFNAHTNRLRSIFLSDPDDSSAGFVELVEFDRIDGPPPPPADQPEVGFFLISFYLPHGEVRPRLEALGHPFQSEIEADLGDGRSVKMATVRDPDGVLVELIDVSS